MRIIIYTGKGGVGKTSAAAATACLSAESGRDTLIISTDAAHSLGDSLKQKLSNEPARVAKHLWAMELDTIAEGERAWNHMQSYLKELLTSRSQTGIETEELLVFPGLDELFALFRIMDLAESSKYERIVVDCAPTGETMALLKFPGKLRRCMETIFPMKRKMAKTAGPLIEKVARIPMPNDSVFDEFERLYEKMDRLHAIISDPDVTTIRIVTTPEAIVVKEAKRNYSYLKLFHYHVDGIIVNKIFPRESMLGYFQKWIANQENSLSDIATSFDPVPVFRLNLMKQELCGYHRLMEAGMELFQTKDPAAIFCHKEEPRYEETEEGFQLKLPLPFVDKQELELLQKDSELFLSIKNEHQTIVLPSYMADYQVAGAKYEDNVLCIRLTRPY